MPKHIPSSLPEDRTMREALRKTRIHLITCPVCKNHAWHSPEQNPQWDGSEWHHPSCKSLTNT
jgi:hypothetical protein